MRNIYRIPLFLLALLWLAACTFSPSQLFMPELSVTPATAPLLLPTATPLPLVEAAADSEHDPAPLPTPSPSAVPTPTLPSTTAPQRTPIRIKVPASALIQPTVIVVDAVPTETPDEPPPTSSPTVVRETEQAPNPTPVVGPTTTATPATRGDGQRTFENTLNVLVVGSDERSSGTPWRSDVIMVLAVDFSSHEVGVISFPRDLYIDIPTVGQNRINTATFFGELNGYKDGGGIGLLQKTIEKNFGIRIDHYVKINFSAFKDLVNALGGIDVTVDCPIYGNFPREEGSQKLVYQTLQPGKYHMDGLFALRYARERKSTSDVDRTRRQQRVLISIRNRAREVNIISRLLPLYDALSKSIETDLGLSDVIALARLGIQIEPDKAHGFIIGFRETDSWTTPSGAYVLLPKMAVINERIQHLFSEPSILKNPQKPRNCKNVDTGN
ncbi:MAG: hypothetical protein GXP37_07020 [Chloroflexi bacterium]|nr:hypothetical protein [Chloroflexota bacterium]